MATTVTGLERLQRKLAAIPAAVRMEMRAALETNATELSDMMRRMAPVSTPRPPSTKPRPRPRKVPRPPPGRLRDSIGWRFVEAESGDSGVGLRAGRAAQTVAKGNAGLAVEVYAGDRSKRGVYYARWVEYGTKPGVRKRSVTYSQGTGGSGLSLRSTASGGRKRTRRVYRTHPGTRPNPFFFPAYRALRRRMQARLTRAMTKAIKREAAKTTGAQ
ncbi:HK97 gp10 family phage protein [Tistrella bauzanensis]|uniref:HK97 gp10 family phage protein n=1 Tax=Tistrella TaxID=171436 RepID=UPI0031F61F94